MAESSGSDRGARRSKQATDQPGSGDELGEGVSLKWMPLVVRAVADEKFYHALMENPSKVLADEGFDVPEEGDLNASLVEPLKNSVATLRSQLRMAAVASEQTEGRQTVMASFSGSTSERLTSGTASAATIGTFGTYCGTMGSYGTAGSGQPTTAATLGTFGTYCSTAGTAGTAGSGQAASQPALGATLGTFGTYCSTAGTAGTVGQAR